MNQDREKEKLTETLIGSSWKKFCESAQKTKPKIEMPTDIALPKSQTAITHELLIEVQKQSEFAEGLARQTQEEQKKDKRTNLILWTIATLIAIAGTILGLIF